MKALVLLIIVILTLCYPLLVFVGINHTSPAIFGFGLMLFMGVKLALTKDTLDRSALLISAVVIFYSVVVAINNSELWLKFYPVVVSLAVALLFLKTLFEEQSMIERFARAAKKNITLNAKTYTKKLTLVWVIVLAINSGIAAYLAVYGSLKIWTLYNGLVSYGMFATLFLIEFLYRQYYIKKYGK